MIDITNINNENWNNKNISILGGGKSGIAAAKLCKYIGAEPFISDNNITDLKPELKKFNHEIGQHSNKILNSDLVIISPGIPSDIKIVKKCKSNNINVVSEIEFASWFTNSNIIAVTGSNGKSTTVNLIHNIFKIAGKPSLLGGNFDIPFSQLVIDEKLKFNKPITYILELSSFQLENIVHFTPDLAVILNISPDHLDRYKNINKYIKAKLNIIKNLREPGWLIINSGDILLSNQLHDYDRLIPFSRNYCPQALVSSNKTKIYYHKENKKNILCYINETKLIGIHNVENILAAVTVALKCSIKHNFIKDGIIKFTSLPHRMEFCCEINGVKYYNDSKATNITSTIAALKAFPKNVILILGGKDKGESDFYELIPSLKKNTKYLIAYGESRTKIFESINKYFSVNKLRNFQDAILKSIQLSSKGDIVLLSPACSSFDQFKNFEKRGDMFKKILTTNLYD